MAIKIRDTRRVGHFWADNEILDIHGKNIGIFGFSVYMMLCRYSDNKTASCYPSISKMGVALKISESSVKRGIALLLKENLIAVSRDGFGPKVTNIYTILETKKMGSNRPEVKEMGSIGTDNGFCESTEMGSIGTSNYTHINNTHKPNSDSAFFFEDTVSELKDSLGLQEKPNYEFQANQIYAVYPRKVGRAAALKVIIRRLKEGIPYERLLERVHVFARSPAGQAGQYTPHAATWFNRESYNDDEKEWFKNGKQNADSKFQSSVISAQRVAEKHRAQESSSGGIVISPGSNRATYGSLAEPTERQQPESDSGEFPDIFQD